MSDSEARRWYSLNMFSSEDGGAMTKSERTRAHLREVALRSFRERGYDATTIRLIAQEAGVSVGTTNYHFASKSDLVQELYLDVQEHHRAAALPRLAEASGLVDRLRVVYDTGLDQLGPYHAHAAEFVSAALAPRSSMNPLSADSGAAHALPGDLVAELPRVFFVAHLLLAMYWVYDDSPGQQRTRRLLDRGLTLLRLALPLARVPLLRKPLTELAALIGEARP